MHTLFTDTVARQSLVKFQGMFMKRKSFQQLKTKISIHNRALLKVKLALIAYSDKNRPVRKTKWNMYGASV